MAFKRTAIGFFELANAAYASSTVTFFGVDPATNLILATLITLYAGKTGATTFSNPYALDSDGKFSAPVYADERFIAVVEDVNGQQHTTGIWEPALSTADVAAAAASATAAAASEASATLSATSASISAVAAAASAAAALAAVGTVYSSPTDATLGVLSAKIAVTGLVGSTPTSGKLQLSVTPASDPQALAKALNTVALTPANLAALNGDTATTGLVRFSTVAEATTGTISTAAVTPAGLSAALGNTITSIRALQGDFTNVSAGANVTMTAGLRYRFTATVAAQVNFPTTFGSSAHDFSIIEFACTTGATMTVGRGGATIDGTAANDTSSRYGDVILYHATAVGTIRSVHSGFLPS